MGDERTYENAVALRAVTSTDGMTADWAHLPYEFLAKMSNDHSTFHIGSIPVEVVSHVISQCGACNGIGCISRTC